MRPARKRRSTSPVSRAPRPLSAKDLRWRCPTGSFDFQTTAQVSPLEGVVGQETALDALRFGLMTYAPGQNIFVRGLSGTGRFTMVTRLIREIQADPPELWDRCYVHNFKQVDRPLLISLPAGLGRRFKRQMDRVATFVRDHLPKILTSESFAARRKAIESRVEDRLGQLVKPFEESLAEAGLSLVTIQLDSISQKVIFPLVDGKPVPPEEFDQLHADGKISDEMYQGTRDKQATYLDQLGDVQEKVNELRSDLSDQIEKLYQEGAREAMNGFLRGTRRAFPDPAVQTFLDELVDDLVEHRLLQLGQDTEFTHRYQVNVVIDRSDTRESPIVVEATPTLGRLLGAIDYDLGPKEEVRSGHMGIRAGSLLEADGGYLVMEARDVLNEAGAWKLLVRTLRTRRLEIMPSEMRTPWSGPSITPAPVDIRVKVILLGDDEVFYLLDGSDPDFSDLFKVLADFDSVMDRDEAGLHQYASWVARLSQQEELLPFARSGVAALAEHGARIAAKGGKLTARFGRLADVAREASFVASESDRKRVLGDEVKEAVRRSKRRADLPARRFREAIADGTIRIATKGREVGQVNGLAVLRAGPLNYGFPARITATIGPGSSGVINIEREAALSGAIHTKSFYILGGLLRTLLRTDHPLAFDASVAFEQSYGGIDGDSASGAEMCCLLSALTDIPLRQDVAMTGAIDQMGNVLAIGAANEKIEGFYDVCADGGLTGTQGVIIPKANAADLMLREDVVKSCAQRQFFVYVAESVYEAIEILAGMPAGRRDRGGRYPEGTLLCQAMNRAREYWIKAVGTARLVEEAEE